MEYILPPLDPVERVAIDPFSVDVDVSCFASKAARTCRVERVNHLCLKICRIGKAKVTISIVRIPTTIHIGGTQYLLTEVNALVYVAASQSGVPGILSRV